MQNNMNSMAPVSSLAVEDRSQFIWKCYAHVVGAILALIAIEYYLFTSGAAAPIKLGRFPLRVSAARVN